MAASTNLHRITFSYVCITAAAVFFTWMLHEFAHWAAGKALGYAMAMTLNSAYPVAGYYSNPEHAQLVTAAGPLVTLLQAVILFILMRRTYNKILYAFLVTCFYLRLLAGLISFLNPNDEARLSAWLGLGTFTLPIVVVALLFWLLYKTATRHGVSKKFTARTLLLILIFSSALIMSDQFMRIRVL